MQCLDLKHGQAVTIDWLDSRAITGWNKLVAATPGNVRSLGYVVANTDEAIAITTSIEAEGFHYDALSVPWGCITRVEVLPDDWAREGPDEPAG